MLECIGVDDFPCRRAIEEDADAYLARKNRSRHREQERDFQCPGYRPPCRCSEHTCHQRNRRRAARSGGHRFWKSPCRSVLSTDSAPPPTTANTAIITAQNTPNS